jgi:hypothetical protein
MLAMATPLPHPPTTPVVMLAVPHPSWAMWTPMPIPPSTIIFLGPQPEPPDKALKRYKEYLAGLKEWTDRYAKSIDDALSAVEEEEKELKSSQTQS